MGEEWASFPLVNHTHTRITRHAYQHLNQKQYSTWSCPTYHIRSLTVKNRNVQYIVFVSLVILKPIRKSNLPHFNLMNFWASFTLPTNKYFMKYVIIIQLTDILIDFETCAQVLHWYSEEDQICLFWYCGFVCQKSENSHCYFHLTQFCHMSYSMYSPAKISLTECQWYVSIMYIEQFRISNSSINNST